MYEHLTDKAIEAKTVFASTQQLADELAERERRKKEAAAQTRAASQALLDKSDFCDRAKTIGYALFDATVSEHEADRVRGKQEPPGA